MAEIEQTTGKDLNVDAEDLEEKEIKWNSCLRTLFHDKYEEMNITSSAIDTLNSIVTQLLDSLVKLALNDTDKQILSYKQLDDSICKLFDDHSCKCFLGKLRSGIEEKRQNFVYSFFPINDTVIDKQQQKKDRACVDININLVKRYIIEKYCEANDLALVFMAAYLHICVCELLDCATKITKCSKRKTLHNKDIHTAYLVCPHLQFLNILDAEVPGDIKH